ncbi:MAG: hypothetical protein L0Y57_01295 [Beijerinckiaceae bacterium]|nr:hypothetical protein [Beijerinckiaceae bacterium]
MRTTLTAFFVAMLAGIPASSGAAPRNIDECEKIQAADAYNQCLAMFGPVARGHRGLANGAGAIQEAKAAGGTARAEAAAEQATPRSYRRAGKRGWTKNRWARHAKGQRARIVLRRNGNAANPAMAFSVDSSRTRLR